MGAAVARVIRENTQESILCVCYTNHALDQFLEHMVDAGEKRIVRIGGRSKSERLAGYQLKELARKKSRNEGLANRLIKQVHARLFSLKEKLDENIKILKTPISWTEPSGGIHEFLRYEKPEVLAFLHVPEGNDDEFTMVGRKGKALSKDFLWTSWQKGEGFPSWLSPHMILDNDEYPAFLAFWKLSMNERATEIASWRKDILSSLTYDLEDLAKEFKATAKEDQALCREAEGNILAQARIIGATTSGAATYHDLLTEKAAGVVLVEEAGEVLESHILTSLALGTEGGESSKHLVLIGDHKQLPPKVENYELTATSGCGYDLDCSLFERLVSSGLPSVTLDVQHRMRPSISALIRLQTYPSLRDHESVTKYPQVKGSTENLMFIDHDVLEDGANAGDSTTKSNQYEANLCIEIVRFLLLQGYGTSQIVVLTPYLGQLRTIIDKMRQLREIEALVSDRDTDELDDLDSETGEQQHIAPAAYRPTEDKRAVRCSSIDNYQGEEADVVVISCKLLVSYFVRIGWRFIGRDSQEIALFSGSLKQMGEYWLHERKTKSQCTSLPCSIWYVSHRKLCHPFKI